MSKMERALPAVSLLNHPESSFRLPFLVLWSQKCQCDTEFTSSREAILVGLGSTTGIEVAFLQMCYVDDPQKGMQESRMLPSVCVCPL